MDISGSLFYSSFSRNPVSAGSVTSQQSTEQPSKNNASEHASAIDNTTPSANNDNIANNQSTKSNSEQNNFSQNSKNQENAKIASQLSEEEIQKVQELKQRDQEVRTHEAAHLAAAGKYATGGASFDYKRGPDGKNYAVGGEVGIDTSPVPNNPQATIQKAQQIKAAAQAPAQPSSTDRQVAASAAQMETKARQELAEQKLNGTEQSEQTKKVSKASNENDQSSEDETKTDKNNLQATSTYQRVSTYSESSSKQPALNMMA